MRRSPWTWAPVALLLGAAGVFHLGYQGLVVGLGPQDAGQYETVLAVATAGQLQHGPGALYGPYSGDNPSVLMHAPGYYRLVALAALVPTRLGADPVDASLAAGRVVSGLSTLALLLLVARLARLDGARGWAGVFAASLVASSPILGVLAIMLRPDALGVALSTGGLVLILGACRDDPCRRRTSRAVLAYALFALAVDVKQQNVVVPALSTLYLGISAARRRVPPLPLAAGLVVGGVVGASALLLEHAWTGGLMWRTVFEMPGGAFRAINYGGWGHVQTILLDCLKRSAGMVALGLIAVVALGRRAFDQPLDRLLVVLLAAEVVALVPLCLYNKGAADNYALQAVVLAAALVGRLLDRALLGISGAIVPRLAFVLVAGLLLANDLRLIRHVERCRRAESEAVATLLEDPRVASCPAKARYFAGDQEFNRLFGRRDLIHDEWLYGAFEAIGAAEPRSSWLQEAISEGPVRQVVLAHEAPRVPGVDGSLPELGFERVAAEGAYTVWVRR